MFLVVLDIVQRRMTSNPNLYRFRSPNPRKLSPASISIASAIFVAVLAYTSSITFGGICLIIILHELQPAALAATIDGCSLTASTCDLMILAIVG